MADLSGIDPSDIDESSIADASIDETIKSPLGIASPANTSTEIKKVFFICVCILKEKSSQSHDSTVNRQCKIEKITIHITITNFIVCVDLNFSKM